MHQMKYELSKYTRVRVLGSTKVLYDKRARQITIESNLSTNNRFKSIMAGLSIIK